MLDKKKNYGYVSGVVDGFPGARYFQDGKYFGPAGNDLGANGKPTTQNTADYGALHWKQLKKLVEDKGGRYETREAAILFLTKA